MFFEEADNSVENLDLKAEVNEILLYEYRYKVLIERVDDYHYNHRMVFLAAWYQELIGSIRTHSLAHDREFFEALELDALYKKYLYAQLLLYRYDQNISIMDDLNFEKTHDYMEDCKKNLKKKLEESDLI